MGSVFAIFYVIFPKKFNFTNGHHLAIASTLVKSISQDISLSIFSGLIFAFCGALIMISHDLGLTLIYTEFSKYGLFYIFYSFLIVLLMQDTYFYFLHRLLHRPKLFKWLHRGHHNSLQPTPWTSFAFDPFEAFIQSLFLVIIVFIVPLHYIVFFVLLTTMTIWSIINHLGFQLFYKFFKFQWVTQWIIGSQHHLLHHQKFNVHYGLYFTFWDRLLNTQDVNYDS